MMTFRQLQKEHAAWSAHNFGDQPSHFALLGAMEEVGELVEAIGAMGRLAHAHLKCEQGIRGTYAEHELAKQDAVADIIIFLTDYCTRENFDLQSVVEMTWAKVKQRDWKAYPQSGGLPPAPPTPAAASVPAPDDNDDLVLPGRHIRVFYPCGCEASGPMPPPLYCPRHGSPAVPDKVLQSAAEALGYRAGLTVTAPATTNWTITAIDPDSQTVTLNADVADLERAVDRANAYTLKHRTGGAR